MMMVYLYPVTTQGNMLFVVLHILKYRGSSTPYIIIGSFVLIGVALKLKYISATFRIWIPGI